MDMNMTPNAPTKIAIMTALALLAPMAATAQQEQQRQQPPRPDISKMAADMGVSANMLKTCMPAPAKGARPERPDAAKITKCLNNAKAHISQSKVDAVLKANAPKGRG